MKTGKVKIIPHHNQMVGGKYGGKKGSILLRGWHSNYAEFKHKKLNGTLVFNGEKIMVEIGKSHRWEINLGDLVELLAKEAEGDQ